MEKMDLEIADLLSLIIWWSPILNSYKIVYDNGRLLKTVGRANAR